MSTKDQYLLYCESGAYVPLFFKPCWLDQFDIPWQVQAILLRGEQHFLVYFEERKLGFRFLRNPPITPYHGLLPIPASRALNQEDMGDFFRQLPPCDEVNLDCWPGLFQEQEAPLYGSFRRTNILELTSLDELFHAFKPSLQRQIRKAERNLLVNSKVDPGRFVALYKRSMEQRGIPVSVHEELLLSMINRSLRQGYGNVLFAEDAQQALHAALFFVWDEERVYYLLGGTDKAYYGSGAMGFLLWQVIQFATEKQKQYVDFEGSDDEGIHRFFQTFSPSVISYLHLQKQDSGFLRMVRKWQQR